MKCSFSRVKVYVVIVYVPSEGDVEEKEKSGGVLY